MKRSTGIVVVAMMLAVGGACSLQSQDAPSLTGPSEFGLSLEITASPDVIFQDGGSQSLITIIARDHQSQPVAGLGLLAQTAVNGSAVDFGRLAAKSLVTDNQGRATVVYTAPSAPPPTAVSDAVVQVLVTPLGTNYDSTFTRGVSIRLARPGVIAPPSTDGAPTASFVYSPTGPDVGTVIFFDASASTDDGTIVRYEWYWGDGETATSTTPFEEHDYRAAGTYVVQLTVVDNVGATGTAAQELIVGGSTGPTAVFTYSPTEVNAGETIHFNGTESTAPGGQEIANYRWNFGDGSAEESGAGLRLVDHVFAAAGEYVVTLTVTDTAGKHHAVSRAVTVQ